MADLDSLLTEGTRELLLRTRAALESRGQLPSRQQLAHWIESFQRRFSPTQLAALDGAALLEHMHQHGSRDSLVYWLEFKDDDEFPRVFGSIAGGSALKFGLYRRAETGVWMTGAPNNQLELSVDQAIEIALRHRDQLVAAAHLLAALPADADSAAYEQVDVALSVAAPDIGDAGWVHKYLCLAAAEKLDDYHSVGWQQFMLVKLLRLPAQTRYANAYSFVRIARELGLSVFQLTRILNEAFGEPRSYWRVGTSEDAPRDEWPRMRDHACVAIGWPALGDLSALQAIGEDKEKLRGLLAEKYPKSPQVIGRLTQQIFHFVVTVSPGDLVMAADGETLLGIGRITGEYRHEPAENFSHMRPVDWLDIGEWSLPMAGEGLRTTFKQLTDPVNLIAIERRLRELTSRTPLAPVTAAAGPKIDAIGHRIDDLLERKGQVILYGPPGTGKTYRAEKTAQELAAWESFRKPYEALDAGERERINGTSGVVRMTSFHPSYGYEDFVEGYRPVLVNGQMVFEKRDGIFKRLCADAARAPAQRFFLLIDEINRGDVPRVLGELMTLLELDKREKPIVLPVSGDRFSVPRNVRIIATMNTADRSIALLDVALRRRFGFVELLPDYRLLSSSSGGQVNVEVLLRTLNLRIQTSIKRDARNLQIGHAYLLKKEKPLTDLREVGAVLRNEIIPLLEEYCYEDATALAEILGPGFVDEKTHGVLDEVFEGTQALSDALMRLGQGILLDQPAPLDAEDAEGEARE